MALTAQVPAVPTRGRDAGRERKPGVARITARGMWLSAALLATVGAGQARADPEARCCLVTCMGAGSSPSCVPQVAFNGFICAMSLCDTVCASQGGCAEGIFNSELCPPGQVAAGCDASGKASSGAQIS